MLISSVGRWSEDFYKRARVDNTVLNPSYSKHEVAEWHVCVA